MKTQVVTNIDHNIDEDEFKEVVSKTASLIKYQGIEYFDKLKALNDEYEISNNKVLTHEQYALKMV